MKWFQHDTDTLRNRKVRKVIRTHGATGYGIWWAILEKVYSEEGDFQILADQLWLEDLADDLKISDYRTLIRVLDTFAEVGLISSQLWLGEHIIYVEAIAERGDAYLQKRMKETEKKRRQRAAKKTIEPDSRVNDSLSPGDKTGTRGQTPNVPPTDPDPDPDPDLRDQKIKLDLKTNTAETEPQKSANADRVLAPDPWNPQTAPTPATRKAPDPEPRAVDPEPEPDVIQGELVEPIPANPLPGQNQGSGEGKSSAANLSKKKKEKFTAEQFDTWWQAVGHKEGKADARKVFLGMSPADVSLEQLIASRQAQEKWHVEHNGTLQYLKRPPAWLRAEAWDDQMEPISSAGLSPEAIKQAKHADAIKQRILAKQGG